MQSFKTEKGTELPLRNLKGNDYLEVKWRLVWFREQHPDWGIETSFIEIGDKHSIARAVIVDSVGRVRATSHKREDASHFADHAEKAETGAIGRALALCGFGTQFAEELEEGERIVDAPVAKRPSPGPSKTAALNTRLGFTPPAPTPPTSMPEPPHANYVRETIASLSAGSTIDRSELNALIMDLHPKYIAIGGQDLVQVMQAKWKVSETRMLSVEQLKELSDFMARVIAGQAPAAATPRPRAAVVKPKA